MKIVSYALISIMVLLLFSAATSQDQTTTPTLEGTWEQINQYTYDGEKIVDTVQPTKGYRQIKMFYNGKVMWSRFVPQDSVEWFAYGSYETTDSTLTETLEYGSASMMRVIDTARVFNFKLIVKENWYSQIATDSNGNPLFSENYKRVD